MHPRRPRGTVGTVGVVLLVPAVLAACSGGSSPSPVRSSGASSTASASKPATASPSPTATGFAKTCDDALPISAVDQAAGQPIIGNTSFVVGVPEANIGRLAYLNCQYGLADPVAGQPAPVALLEIGVSLYDSADQATTRAQGTVDDYRSHAAAPSTVRVGSVTGTILTGYGVPTLVVAQGARTVAVSADPSVLTSNNVLVALAALALTNVS